MTPAERARFAQAVQANCDIADARHADEMTLCTYLLQMREFHRWERGLPLGAPLDRAAVGAWIAEREAHWERVAADDYARLPLGDRAQALDPFDTVAVNEALAPAGLLYGAGLAGPRRPVFFLADLHARTRREGIEVASGGRELARGLLAPPAALGGADDRRSIVIRRESLARWCWEKYEAFSLRRPEGSPFAEVVRAYGLDRDFEAALPRWLDEQGEAAVLHEIGEYRAGLALGPAWSAMRVALPGRRGELYARAVRDHLADLAVTLPSLLDRGAAASIHVWFSNFDGIREVLFPSLYDAYLAWRDGDSGRALRAAIVRGSEHFWRLARAALARYARGDEDAAAEVERLLQAPEAVCPG